MEHHPLMTLNDNTEITYSDLKKDSGSEYITIYFETPDDSAYGFKSCECNYPVGKFDNIIGYTDEDLNVLQLHLDKLGDTALLFAKEDFYAYAV